MRNVYQDDERTRAATSGASPDPHGYAITIDGTDRGALGVSGAVTIGGDDKQ